MDPQAIDPETQIDVSVLVRPRRPLAELEARPGAAQVPLSREAFAAAYGADPADLAKVEAFAREHGLKVLETSAPRRTVRLAGRTAEVARAFGVSLRQVGAHLVPNTEPVVPPDLREIVQGVFGLDTRPVARRG